MITKLPSCFHTHILDTFNSIFQNQTFPPSWHEFLVFLLPKSTPGKFRPITLASCMLKLMEKLIITRLSWWVEANNILPSTQFGFRKGKSCAFLAILTTEIITGFAKNRSTTCIFLDIKGAFDNVIPSKLIHTLT